MKKKEEITALMDNDFDKLLIQTSQYDEFQNGEIECRVCRCQITYDNVGIIVPVVSNKGILQLEFVCNDPNCLTSK